MSSIQEEQRVILILIYILYLWLAVAPHWSRMPIVGSRWGPSVKKEQTTRGRECRSKWAGPFVPTPNILKLSLLPTSKSCDPSEPINSHPELIRRILGGGAEGPALLDLHFLLILRTLGGGTEGPTHFDLAKLRYLRCAICHWVHVNSIIINDICILYHNHNFWEELDGTWVYIYSFWVT